jgi:hypothetical protein
MKNFTFALLILLFCNSYNLKASSNKGFKEGYIITLEGDTINGFLLKQISRKASEECVFKTGDESASKIYKPGEISGYRYLNDKYYVSKEIKIDSITKKVVFLEFLIKGLANVYYYVDDMEHYYIEKFPAGLVELTEKERIFHQVTNSMREEDHAYIIPAKTKGKLITLLQDCPGIYDEILSTTLTHKSLIKLTKDYHEKMCNTESCIIYERDNTAARIKIGAIIGFSKNQYNFGGQCISNYANLYQIGAALKFSNILMFNEHLNLKVNILFEKDSKSYTLNLPDNTKHCYITYNDVSYNLIDLRHLGNPNAYLPSMKADLNVIDLKIPISINCDFNLTKNTIYTCGIGLSNKIILSQNKNFKVDEFYARYGKSINSLLNGIIVSTGIEGNWFGGQSFFINMSYEYLMDFRANVDNALKLKNNQFALQVGVYF